MPASGSQAAPKAGILSSTAVPLVRPGCGERVGTSQSDPLITDYRCSVNIYIVIFAKERLHSMYDP